jgi:predicted TIM-barrel fold metal-dependent hydrolase
MEIFDAHTHFFGREFYEFQTALVPGGNRAQLLRRIEAGGLEVPGPDAGAHRERWLAELDRHGVARAVMFASVPPEMPSVGEAAAASGGRFVPYAAINPRIPRTLDMLELLVSRFGFRGVVLFPAMHEYAIGDAVAAPALDLAACHGLCVFVHCGRLRIPVRAHVGLAPDFPPEASRPLDLIPVARARPDTVFIVPHFGAGLFEELLELGAACPNVYADTAGTNAWATACDPPRTLADLFRETRDVMGASRILYGSDSGTFPRGYRGDVLEAQRAAMAEAGFGEAEAASVLGGNLARLLGR